MDSMSMIEGLERLKHPPVTAGREGGSRMSESLHHFDLQVVDILMDIAHSRGHVEGNERASDWYEGKIEELRDQLVKDALSQVLTWLVPLYSRLEEVLIAPVSPDPERPDDEWADDRDERLQAIVDRFRFALPLLAESAGQSALAPKFLEGQVSLWREVHPVERVEDVKAVPATSLTNRQLEAVLMGDTAAFEHADKVIVPDAIETLQRRAVAAREMDPPDEPVAAEILERHGLGVVDAEVFEEDAKAAVERHIGHSLDDDGATAREAE